VANIIDTKGYCSLWRRQRVAVCVRAEDGRRADFEIPAPGEAAGEVVMALGMLAAIIWDVELDEIGIMFGSDVDAEKGAVNGT
jgi:hypothetical protein